MKRIGVEWWNTHCYTGHSAMQMYVIEKVLDGGWKAKFTVRSIIWKIYAKDRDAKLYLRMLEPWRIA